ncbi:hypothetical protein [Undibacterium sp.]|uniref:hypothetical protein n=1 Tax=Undibacterium sp. TaxID=1914977 RepID=UPI003752417E
MLHRDLILNAAKADHAVTKIARQLYFLTSSYAFHKNHDTQLELYEKICVKFSLPLSAIRLVGSAHTGFSLVKGTNFDKSTSDLDIAIVDSGLYLQLFQMAFKETNAWSDTSKFPGIATKQIANKDNFLKYLRKGVIRPDLLPSSPLKADWENFFGKLSDEYSAFCNQISAGVYATEHFMAAKQESALNIYLSNQGSI